MVLGPHCCPPAGRGRNGSPPCRRAGSGGQGRMAASGLAGRRPAMTMVGRAIGLIVLCFLAGLLLSRLGITARGILTDTWATILSVFVLLADWMQWALPYILLGAVVVVPLFLLATLQRFARQR